ncbi:phosphoribosylamine--glycine ligase [Sinomonas sp.]|uniref:phosphoribosylamine--glycine ligase n=1 Tax=Sinomonas sp. TaxID=1914986 RepID=UPI003F7D1077
MKLLIIGSGAREHALAWKFRQDDPNIELIAAPGNPGIATIAQCFPVRADDIDGLFALAQAERPDVTVVGPEAPLEAGIVDRFTVGGFPIFGPTQAAARIETSKRYAKEIMRRAGVATAAASHHTDVHSAMRAARMFGAPVVIKASGLAAGKGVVIAETMAEAERAIRSMLGGALGQAGREILVEQFMDGEELSVFALCAGNNAMLLRGVQDHKRLLDGDHGPNTGGMGAYTPVSIDTSLLQYRILNDVIQPTLAALTDDGSPFTGLLYAGLMVSSSGVRVVEFNCRFGDPETEALLPLMLSSLLDPVAEIARGGRVSSASEVKWRIGSAVTTVVAAPGYPTQPRLGERVTLPPPDDNVYVFHAGTRIPEDLDLKPDEVAPLLSAGGRVLAVTGVAPTLDGAARKSQQYAERVQLSGKQFRHDIGWRELARVRSRRVQPSA